MSATVEVSRNTLEAMAEILRHILATQPAVSPHPPQAAPQTGQATPAHSLRDVMATCAMQGLWSSGRINIDASEHCQRIARTAYHQADCMLWQAEFGSPPPGGRSK